MDFDNLSGTEFEVLCAELLRKDGFQNVQLTKASGDQGVDIIAVKNGVRFAIQCKCYSKHVGSSAVRDVYAGKDYREYKCDVAVVLTNSKFTDKAREFASDTGVLLWDSSELERLTNQAKLFDRIHNKENSPIIRNLLGVSIDVPKLFEDVGVKAGQPITQDKIKLMIQRVRKLTNTPIESEHGSEPAKFVFNLIKEFELDSVESLKTQEGCLASLFKAIFGLLFKFILAACVAVGILYGFFATIGEMMMA